MAKTRAKLAEGSTAARRARVGGGGNASARRAAGDLTVERMAALAEVVLVGGSSSVGKTTLAGELARRGQSESVQVDDLRRGIDDPRLDFLSRTRDPWRLEPGELCLRLRAAAEAMRPALAALVDRALADGRRLVLEGEALDPSLAARYCRDARVRPVFVVELDRERLARTLRDRSPAFESLPSAEQSAVAHTNALYGRWLKAECRERNLSCVASQPWETLVDRATHVIESPRLGARPARRPHAG